MLNQNTEINFNKDWWIKSDMTTFSGRMQHWICVADMRKSFTSAAQLKWYLNEIEEAKAMSVNGIGMFTEVHANNLRRNKMVTLSGVHPDSGEVIPWFARISAFVPINIPIIAAMSLAAPTPFNTIFW